MRRASQFHPWHPGDQVEEIGHDNLTDSLKDTLVEVIRRESGNACFATDRVLACPEVHCKWREDCHHLTDIWLL